MFEPGEHVGEMHCHTPSSFQSPLKEDGYQVKSIFEIDTAVANAISDSILDMGFAVISCNNKQAYVVSEGTAGELMVIYSYDHRFYLTTLSNAPAPYAVFPENAKA